MLSGSIINKEEPKTYGYGGYSSYPKYTKEEKENKLQELQKQALERGLFKEKELIVMLGKSNLNDYRVGVIEKVIVDINEAFPSEYVTKPSLFCMRILKSNLYNNIQPYISTYNLDEVYTKEEYEKLLLEDSSKFNNNEDNEFPPYHFM